MTKVLHAVFDGKVFQPKEPIDLAPNTSWILLVTSDALKFPTEPAPHPFERTGALATDMGPADLSERFDYYIGRR
ncbi:hypothetical protein HUU05_13690 [candidate division KSB1 bacterium]|nr:hypothetical protein [candidate division KSB1 bacterium]